MASNGIKGTTRTANIVCKPYRLKNVSPRSSDVPIMRCANGFPSQRDSTKQIEAPISVLNQESSAPQRGPKTKPLVIATTLPGSGAIVDWAIIRQAEIATAHGP